MRALLLGAVFGLALRLPALAQQSAPPFWNTPGSSGGGSGTITGVTAGTNLTGGGTSGNVTLGLTPTPAISGLGFSGSISSPSVFPQLNNAWVSITGNVNGTQTFTGSYSPLDWTYNWSLNALSSTSADYGEIHTQNLQNGYAGNVGGLQLNLFGLGAPPLPGTDTSTHEYSLLNAHAEAEANVGGTDLNAANALGFWAGGSSSMTIDAAATNVAQGEGWEVDFKAATPAVYQVGLFNELGSATTTRGALGDYGEIFGGANAAWKNLISCGGATTTCPQASDSILLSANPRTTPQFVALNGPDTAIDMEWAPLTSYFYRTAGAAVDGSGNQYANNVNVLGNLAEDSATVASVTPVADNSGLVGGAFFSSASFETCNLQTSTGGGTNATCSVAAEDLTKALILTSGTGGSNGDTLTLTGGTGTEPTLTIAIASFTGSISGNTLTVGTVTGAALAPGMLLVGSGVPTLTYIASGSGTTWKLTGDVGTVASAGMTATGVAIASAGSLTAKSATPGTTGGTFSVQPTFNLGFGVATLTVGTVGSAYGCKPEPKAWLSGYNNSMDSTAVLAVAMSCSAGPVALSNGAAIASGAVLSWNADTGLSRGSAGTIDVGTGAQGNTNGTLQGSVAAFGTFKYGGKTLFVNSAPSVAAAGCGGSGASVSANNGSAAYTINVGTSNTGVCTVTMPAASTGWVCSASDMTTTNTNVFLTKETAKATNSVTLSNFSDAAAAHAWVDNDTLLVQCTGY